MPTIHYKYGRLSAGRDTGMTDVVPLARNYTVTMLVSSSGVKIVFVDLITVMAPLRSVCHQFSVSLKAPVKAPGFLSDYCPQTSKQTNKQTNKHTHTHTHKQTNKQTTVEGHLEFVDLKSSCWP